MLLTMNVTMRKLFATCIALCGVFASAMSASDTVSIALSRPIVRESDATNPIQVIVSRLSGGSDLPVSVEISGTALQDTDFMVSGLAGYTPTKIRVASGGGGYSSPPSVTIGGLNNLATASMGLASATVSQTSLYTGYPTIEVSSATGTGVTATVQLGYADIFFPVDRQPTTLTGGPFQVSATESPKDASGVRATAQISISPSGATISVVNRGTGYDIGQTLTFTYSTGGATPTAISFAGRAAGKISDPAVTILNSGVGYLTPPDLTIVRNSADLVSSPVDSISAETLAVTRVNLDPSAATTVFPSDAFPQVLFSGGNGTGASALVSGATSSLTIPNGQKSVSVTLKPIDDKVIEQAETVQFVLVPQIIISPPYNVGIPSNVVATIADDDMILGWSTIDSLAGEKLFSSEDGFEESTYSLVTSLTPQMPPLTIQDPLRENRHVEVLVDGGTAKLATDYRLTLMFRHSGQPAGFEMQELRSTDAAVLHGMKVNGGAPVDATVIPYIMDAPVSRVSAGDIIQFGSDRTVLYTVRAVNSTTVTIWQPLIKAVPDKALIRNNLSALVEADGGTEWFDIPGGAFLRGLIYERVDFTITPIYDPQIEGAETVQLKLLASNDYLITDPQIQQSSIADDDCLINIARGADASRPTTAGGTGINGSLTVVLNRAFPSNLRVPYFVNSDSTAVAGIDFEPLSGSIVIPAGSTSASIPIIPVFGGSMNRSVVLTLLPTDNYVLLGSDNGGISPSASINILNQVGTVSIVKVADGNEVTSPAAAIPGQFRVDLSRIAGNNAPLSVQYSVSGTAASGVRYTPLSGSVAIPQGANSAFIDVSVLDDQFWQVDQTVIITLKNSAGYNADPNASSATVAIKDNEPYVQFGRFVDGNVIGNVPVQIPVVLCDSSGIPFTVPIQNDVTVTYRLDDGTIVPSDVAAKVGENYSRPYAPPATTGTVTIPKGQLSAVITVPVLTPARPVVDSKFTAVLPVVSPASYGLLVGSGNQSKAAVIAGNQLSVGLSKVRDATSEQPGIFTFTLAPTAATTETIVRYSLSGSARPGLDFQPLSGSVRIPAGSTTASVQVTPLVGGKQSVLTMKVQSGSGYLPRGTAVEMTISPSGSTSDSDDTDSAAGGGSCGLGGGIALMATSLLFVAARLRRDRR